MKAEYFNVIKFRKAISLTSNDPMMAKILLENYLDEYPKDYNAKTYYIYHLIILGEIEKAIDYQLKIEDEVSHSKIFQSHEDKLAIFYSDSHSNRIRILAYEERYKELYDYLKLYPKALKGDDKSLIFWCKVKLGLISKNKVNLSKCPYVQRQMLDYKDEEFRKHIQRHLADYNAESDTPNTSIFMNDFKVDEIIEEVKIYIPSDKRLYTGPISNTYIFKYNDCGRDNNKITDYFKVVCYHNTDKIITMCPISTSGNTPYTDLNYLIDKKDTHTPSQIEKFNKRFRKSQSLIRFFVK